MPTLLQTVGNLGRKTKRRAELTRQVHGAVKEPWHMPTGAGLERYYYLQSLLPIFPKPPYFLAFQPLKMGLTSLPFPFPQSHFQIVLKKIHCKNFFHSFFCTTRLTSFCHAYSLFQKPLICPIFTPVDIPNPSDIIKI